MVRAHRDCSCPTRYPNTAFSVLFRTAVASSSQIPVSCPCPGPSYISMSSVVGSSWTDPSQSSRHFIPSSLPVLPHSLFPLDSPLTPARWPQSGPGGGEPVLPADPGDGRGPGEAGRQAAAGAARGVRLRGPLLRDTAARLPQDRSAAVAASRSYQWRGK